MSQQHSRSKLVTAAGIVLSAALALTACGSDDDNDAQSNIESGETPDVDISYDISEDTEDVSIDGELELDQPTAWIIAEGDGDPIDEESLLHILTANVDIENEEVINHDFDLGGSTLQLTEEFENTNPQAYDVLLGTPIGSDMAFYLPPNSLGQGTPAYLNIIAVEDTVPTHATGTVVDAAERNDVLPAVSLDDHTHAPYFKTSRGDAPEDRVPYVVKRRYRSEVQRVAFVIIQYLSISWSTGQEFDYSCGHYGTRGPAQFELQHLFSGWQEGTEGQQ